MDKLSARLGQNIIIENKPGANSTLGSALAAKADPDGYTFLSMLPAYVINTHLYRLSYSPSQLEPVVYMADLPLFLFVSKDLPVKRSDEHTSELQSLMRISYAVFCLKKENRSRAPIKDTQTRRE